MSDQRTSLGREDDPASRCLATIAASSDEAAGRNLSLIMPTSGTIVGDTTSARHD